jgi:hypothetical protein
MAVKVWRWGFRACDPESGTLSFRGSRIPDMDERSGDKPPTDPTVKRPYERPRILSREPLEAVAAVCAPSPPAKGNPGVCPSGPIAS